MFKKSYIYKHNYLVFRFIRIFNCIDIIKQKILLGETKSVADYNFQTNARFIMKFFKKMPAASGGKNTLSPYNSADPEGIVASTLQQLESLLIPLVKNATVLKVKEATRLHPEAAFRSHFGGTPYFEQGDTWPVNKKGLPLQFVFQVFASPFAQLPAGVRLLQFFCPHFTANTSFNVNECFVKLVTNFDPQRQVTLLPPSFIASRPYCEIVFDEALSLPDWQGLSLYSPDAVSIITALEPEEPWELYEQFCEKLTGNCYYRTQLAGYPRWIQQENTPINSKGKHARLLFQVDSEDNAGLMWGDMGLVYVFYDQEKSTFWFEHQSH